MELCDWRQVIPNAFFEVGINTLFCNFDGVGSNKICGFGRFVSYVYLVSGTQGMLRSRVRTRWNYFFGRGWADGGGGRG